MPAPFTLYTGISSATIGRKNDMSLTIAMGEPMEDFLSPFKKLSNRSHSFSALICRFRAFRQSHIERYSRRSSDSLA